MPLYGQTPNSCKIEKLKYINFVDCFQKNNWNPDFLLSAKYIIAI
jgi:hypothetical protein